MPHLALRWENRSDHVILPETISEEPLGPVVPHGDDQWFDIVKTVMGILIYSEAYSVASDSVPIVKTGGTKVDRLFGLEGSFGQESLGLSETVAQGRDQGRGQLRRDLRPQPWPRRDRPSAERTAATPFGPNAPCTDCPKGGQIYAAPLR